ncbi:eae33434-1c59-4f6e-acae-8ff0b68b54d6 [Sclerotinia trifoliorum]|uniref:Eae33434-1c59-4f6e-acae-8ff0b68b54d6 n=1 Tax=Sclerotinia trifoliorum TaxID=28548 RepID=A0A8H2VM45_9HELO|nr:eae33434-1c59-4f6e-acae-8ff0b68b54d6 [Sclerotinia trifoliorum]
MPTSAETENNNLVLRALFKQIDVGGDGTINFKQLAKDIPVNGENAARHRWKRFKESIAKAPGAPTRATKTENNNLIMSALFKQITVGRIDFKRLAKDMGVKGQNAARHRWRRLLESFGIKDKNGKGKDDSKGDGNEGKEESDGDASSPVKVEANTKVARTKLAGSPLKYEISREESVLETPKKSGKRKIDDADMADEEQDMKMLKMPARRLSKTSATEVVKCEQRWSDDDTEEEITDDEVQEEGSGSGFEDIDYTKIAKKKRGTNLGKDSDDWFRGT